MDTKEIYQTHEFDKYAYAQGLSRYEEFLIPKYFNKNKKTLEVGTAGGRCIFGMLDMGFKDLHGCDLVPEFIDEAIRRDKNNQIKFATEDAVNLTYNDNEFSQLVYTQQIISAVGEINNSKRAINEAYRILENNGVVLFSILNFKERRSNFVYSKVIKYLSFLRKFKRSPFSIQHLPFFKIGGKANYRVLWDNQPYNYWFEPSEFYYLLEDAGFNVISMATKKQTLDSRVSLTLKEFENEDLDSVLFFVCKK